jgi:predicted Zn-dependent protease
MKKLIVIIALATLALSGCAGGKFLGFLATADYVDAQNKAAAAKQAAEIADLKAQLAEYQSVKEQAQAAIDQVNKTEKTIEDLQALAQKAEQEIGSLPKEVIKQIVDLLQAALQ